MCGGGHPQDHPLGAEDLSAYTAGEEAMQGGLDSTGLVRDSMAIALH